MRMKLSCGGGFLRALLLLLNILFVLFGLAMIGFGIYVKVDKGLAAVLEELTKTSSFEGQSLGFLAFVMIGGGVFTVVVSLIGCFGAWCVNPCLLLTYSVILSILMILEFVGFIMAFAYKSKLEDVYKDSLANVFGKALDKNDTKVLDVFHKLEKSLDCCGINGKDDYTQHHAPVPPDCFKPERNRGCSEAIIDLLDKNLPIVGGVLGVVLAIELAILISTICLRSFIRRQPDETYSSNPGEVIHDLVPGRRRNYRAFK